MIQPLTKSHRQLKLIPSKYQQDFVNAPDVLWASENATVRVVGDGAGRMTYILMDHAGHWVGFCLAC